MWRWYVCGIRAAACFVGLGPVACSVQWGHRVHEQMPCRLGVPVGDCLGGREPREPATLILLVELGRWKACLSDRANGRVAWLSGDTLAGLLDGLEAGLVVDGLDWRRAKAPPNRRGR